MKQIVCANCGAKYKLPDTFKSDKAKCKACGSVIDVAAQLGGGDDSPVETAKPAAAKPARAKPAAAKPARAKAAAKSEDSGRSPRRARAAGADKKSKADDGGGDSKKRSRQRVRGAGRTSRQAPAEKGGGSKGMLIGGGVVGLALVVVVIVWMMGEDPAKTDNSAKAGSNAANAEAPKNGQKPNEGAGKGTDGGTAKDANATEATGKDDSTPTEAMAKKDDKPEPKKPARSKNAEPTTADEVYDPKEELEELTWPEGTDESEITETKDLADAVVDGGIVGIRASNTLREMGYKGMRAIINKMRTLNYLSADDTMPAYQFTKLLRGLTLEGYQVPFDAVEVGEDVPLKTAHKNARSVKYWFDFIRKYPTAADFNDFIDRQKKKKNKKGK